MDGDIDALSPLVRVLREAEPGVLTPTAFFVSWQGVLTLVYEGFPESLVRLKRSVEAAVPCLPPENPGSKWPKTSLGCLHDDRRLSPDQLQTLLRLCREWSARLSRRGVVVGCAAVTVHASRSLERVVSRQVVEFGVGAPLCPASAGAGQPSKEERARVGTVLAEPDAEDYWFAASRDGNRRAHYADPCLGVTLTHPLLPSSWAMEEAILCSDGDAPARRDALAEQQHGVRSALSREIAAFCRAVDEALPGYYYWFQHSSLHVTLRAIT